MSNHIWFTSDTHFFHKNILDYEREARQFSCLDEMHEVMIDRWNSVVKPKDTIYHLGDFCFGRDNIKIAERLNGRKRLIMGNHDVYQASEYLKYFDKLYGALFWKRCILTHIPIYRDEFDSRWFLNVHGHLHSKKVRRYITPEVFYDDENYFNVSVEQNDLTPFNSEQIMERIKEIDS